MEQCGSNHFFPSERRITHSFSPLINHPTSDPSQGFLRRPQSDEMSVRHTLCLDVWPETKLWCKLCRIAQGKKCFRDLSSNISASTTCGHLGAEEDLVTCRDLSTSSLKAVTGRLSPHGDDKHCKVD